MRWTAGAGTPVAPGVTVVKLNKRVTGLRVDPAGLATLAGPDGSWQQLPRPANVTRGRVLRSLGTPK
jgi:hypothetical protein